MMLAVLMVGIVISFNPRKFTEFIKIILFTHIAAFCVGGMGMALFYFTNISSVVGNMVSFTVKDFSIKILLFVFCFTYIFIKVTLGWFKRVLIKKQTFYPVKIFFENTDVDFMALVDTGNSLHDPLSNAPVIVAEFNSIKDFLPKEIRLIFYENKENDLSYIISNIDQDFSKRIRMIPFESLGEHNGMLLGFRPDKVEISKEESVITIEDVIIGIYNFKLSKDNAYQGLLNPEVIYNRG